MAFRHIPSLCERGRDPAGLAILRDDVFHRSSVVNKDMFQRFNVKWRIPK